MNDTPEMRLIRQLCEQIEKARVALIAGKPSHALVELEYAQECVVPDNFAEHPNLGTGLRNWLCSTCNWKATRLDYAQAHHAHDIFNRRQHLVCVSNILSQTL